MNRGIPSLSSLRPIVFIAACCALGTAIVGCQDQSVTSSGTAPIDSAATLPRLFSTTPAGLEPAKDFPEVLRTRLNAIEPALLADNGATLSGSERIEMNLFDDVAFTAVVDKSEALEPGRFTLNGHLSGSDGSYFILTYTDGAVDVTAFDPVRGYYEMEPAGDGVVKVSEYAPGKLPHLQHGMVYPDGAVMTHDTMVMPPMDMPQSAMPKTSAAASVNVIDVMVVYTAAAVTGAGGDAAMRARIDKAIAEANTAFTNSKINAKLYLTHAEQISYTESGNLGTDLSRVTGTTDGYMDNVHTLRNTYKADLVSLVVENSGSLAGIGYVMNTNSSAFKPYAFTVVGRQYVGSYDAMIHEVGHNLGCAHDRQNSSNPGVFPYSYGYRFTANGVQYRDIMAYAPGQLIPYFSNPNVLYQGVPTGIADPATNSADNARTINTTAPTEAAFYPGSASDRYALLVVNNATTLTTADAALKSRLVNDGLIVTVKAAAATVSSDANGKHVIVISSTVTSTDVNTKFRAATAGVVNCENGLEDDFGMVTATTGTYGTTTGQTQVSMTGTTHPIAGGLTGLQTVTTVADTYNWGKPNSNATLIAKQPSDATKILVYAYEKGKVMPGLTAPGRRVQIFLTDLTCPNLANPGKTLFDRAAKWAAGML